MTNTLSPFKIAPNQNASDNNYRETTPINIDPLKVLFCNKKCSLDISHLNSIDTLECHMTSNNTKLPYIFINFDHESVPGDDNASGPTSDNKLYVLYNNDEYYLKYILIVNGTIHTPPIPTAGTSLEIVLRLIKSNPTPDDNGDNDNNLCISVFADISDRLTIGSEFFSQIFDVLELSPDFASKVIKNFGNRSDNGDQYGNINVENNWSPSMIIPSNKTFYKYKGTFPFNTHEKPPLMNCNWIIFSESITIHKDTYNTMAKLLRPPSGGVKNEYLLGSLKRSLPKYPVYKYIDSKYREKLEPDDLVIKCEKNGECGAGEIENNDKDELNDRLNKCPLTLSSKEVDAIYSSWFDGIFSTDNNYGLIACGIVFNICAIIIGYYVAKLTMVYTYNFNFALHPITAILWIGKYFWNKVDKHPDAKELSDLTATPAGAQGGEIIDKHTQYLNHYNQFRR